MTEGEKPVVLIAEDERSVAEGYELWLGEQYEIRLAVDGREALDMIDDSVDVVLLDRMMPELSGKEVLRELREAGIDCRVAMVTAVEPDFDVIEMGFDAYITKPPDREELLDTIELLLERETIDDEFQEYHSLMARKSALQTQKTEEELAENDKYQALLDRIDDREQAVDDSLGDLSSDTNFVSAVRELEESEDEFEGDEFEDIEFEDIEFEDDGVDQGEFGDDEFEEDEFEDGGLDRDEFDDDEFDDRESNPEEDEP